MIFRKRQDSSMIDTGAVLLLQIPRTNEKKELAAEQMFAALHGLLTTAEKSFFNSAVHERISFEIAVQKKRIGFYVWVPDHLKSFVEDQIYAQYPMVHISEIEDYTQAGNQTYSTQMTGELKFIANDALPIKTFPSFEVDPLAAITATLAQFDDNEEAWLQFIMRPAPHNWHKKSEKYAAGIRGKTTGSGGIGGVATALWAPPEPGKATPAKLAEFETARASAAEAKSQKLAYQMALRIVYRGNSTHGQARMRIQAITASFKQFNTTYLNGFTQDYLSEDPHLIELYISRKFHKRVITCNIEEVASLFHLPHTNVETPNILWANAKTAEPPANLPLIAEETKTQVSPIAVTNFRGHNTMFGINRQDRSRHLYIIGQTGVGKSGMLELLTISDIYSPYGFAVIDPHGDYAQSILKRIPEGRVNDVIYFNPADTDFPIAFNPMEVTDPKLKTHTASELIGVLKRMFESWGPRLEYILRYSLLALLDYPETTMLDITRILTDKKFREEVLTYVQDPVVKNFWTVEFASWNDKFQAEAVAPVLNKVGAFTANPIVRNIIGQPKSSFNIRHIMDDRKILIVNLSRGLIGEDNASLLGALLVTKMQLGAMSRADVPADQRVPFYLYVDEFQNFATDSFATILSEARKYALNLTVANQYTAQMSLEVRDAVFGNVGSIISFRTSADDARIMQKYFEPQFTELDIVHLHNLHFAISMIIEGEKVPAFSATSLRLPDFGQDFSGQIIANSRERYAVGRSGIETFMNERYVTPSKSATSQKPKHEPQPKPAQKPAEAKSPATAEKVAKDIIKLTTETPPEAQPEKPAEPPKPKRKRTRSRRKPRSKSPSGSTLTDTSNEPSGRKDTENPLPAQKNQQKNAPEHQPNDTDETVIKLR